MRGCRRLFLCSDAAARRYGVPGRGFRAAGTLLPLAFRPGSRPRRSSPQLVQPRMSRLERGRLTTWWAGGKPPVRALETSTARPVRAAERRHPVREPSSGSHGARHGAELRGQSASSEENTLTLTRRDASQRKENFRLSEGKEEKWHRHHPQIPAWSKWSCFCLPWA